MALVESFRFDDPIVLLRVATRLESLTQDGSIPFVIDNGDGTADCGFASASWVVDLFAWLVKTEVPEEHRRRVIGLLLGYSADAIMRFEERASGRLFTCPVR